MNNEILFKLSTVMDKEDYRKFLYISTFKRNKKSVIVVLLFSLIAAVLICLTGFGFSLNSFFISWVSMFCIIFAGICAKIEWRYIQRIKTDNTGVLGSTTYIDFYEDYLTMESPISEGKSKLEYEKFYKLIECGTYFMFYYSMNMATLLRKKDMEDVDIDEFRNFIKNKFEGKYQKI